MLLFNTARDYSSISKLFHWLIFILIVIALTLGFVMINVKYKPLKSELVFYHKSLGLLILFLMLLRALWGLFNIKPVLLNYGLSIQRLVKYSHILLYFLIILMPVTGIILSSAAGHPPSFFGLFKVVLPIAKNKPFAELMGKVHLFLAWTIISFVSIHIFAALMHHFILRDDVLRRMLPRKTNK